MRYSTTSESKTFTAGTETTIPLADKGAFVNVSYDTDDAIIIKENGMYLISYLYSGKPKVRAKLQVLVKSNSTLLPGSNINVEWEGATINIMTNTKIATLIENDIIELCARADSNTTIEYGEIPITILNIIKIY